MGVSGYYVYLSVLESEGIEAHSHTSFNLVQKRNLKFQYDYYFFLNTFRKKRTFLSVGGKGASRAEHNTSLISGTFVRKKRPETFFYPFFSSSGDFFFFFPLMMQANNFVLNSFSILSWRVICHPQSEKPQSRVKLQKCLFQQVFSLQELRRTAVKIVDTKNSSEKCLGIF